MHHIKPYLIDLCIICGTVSAKLLTLVTGASGITLVDITGKCLYVLVLLITGFTTVYRFVKEVRTDKKDKQKGSEEKESKK